MARTVIVKLPYIIMSGYDPDMTAEINRPMFCFVYIHDNLLYHRVKTFLYTSSATLPNTT